MTEKKYTIVRTKEQLEELKSHILAWDFFAFDTETTGLNVRKDKVIGLSVCGEGGTAFYLPRLTWNKHLHCLQQVISDSEFYEIVLMLSKKELLMWNGSFDVRIVKNNIGIDLTESLLADIMLMKHTVEEEGDFALKKVAIQYQAEIGLDVEKAANEEQLILKENVKANGGTTTKDNYEMYKADLEILGTYACADADLTLRLANLFKQKLENEGLEEFFYEKEVMPLYKYVTIPMEEHGICLDLPLIESTRSSIIEDMAKLENSILAQLEAIPEVKDWKRRKAMEMFPANNKGAFAQALCEYYNLPLPKSPSGKYSLGKKEIENLPHSQVKDFLLFNTKILFPELPEDVRKSALQKALAEGLDAELAEEISWNLYVKAGEDVININSKQQMGQIVFGCLKIKPLSKTDKGFPQFNDDTIQHLADVKKITWAKDLSNYNKLVKIKGTYIDRFLDEQEDGVFYPSFFQHRTISGRYGSDLQQLNRVKEDGELDPIVLKYNNIIREFFVSGPGRAFIDDDFESLEPHVFSHVSGDEGLREIFRKGYDFYSTIAIATEKLVGVSADKKAENYLGKVNKPKRQFAKAYSLGIPYGMGAYALGKNLGVSTKEAEVLIDGYLNGFPELHSWMKDSEWQAKNLGYVSSEIGRIRHLPRVKELYRVYGDQLLNFMFRKSLESRLGKEAVQNMYMDYKNGLNNAKNFQIQSLSASIVNLAAIAINKKLKQLKIDGWVCLQCHDQIIVNVPESRAEEAAKLVQYIMENEYPLSIKLKAPAAIGKNFKEAH